MSVAQNKNHQQLFRFAVVGVIGLVVDIATLYVALALGTGFYVGRAISFVAAATSTWLVNRLWTFQDRQSNQPLWKEWSHYMVLMLGGGSLNYAVYAFCIHYFALVRDWPFIAVGAGSIAGMGANFISARFVIFRHKTHNEKML